MSPVYRLLHVCTDPKHVAALNRFAGPEFDNRVILAQRDQGASGMGAQRLNPGISVELARQGRPVLSRIADVARDSDMVVVHDLDLMKTMVVERIGGGVSVGWRIFGYEIYSRRPEGLCTERTLKAERKQPGPGLGRRVLDRAREVATWHTIRRPDFTRVLRRIDLVFGMIPDEYPELQARWGDLPPFFQLPVQPNFGEHEGNGGVGGNIVLVGHSRSRYNNHLDVLDEVVRFGRGGQWRFLVPFSYGPDGAYAAAVREMAGKHPGIELIESFLPTEEYLHLFRGATAAVYNTFRQLALWNIFAAVSHGVKVYIPARNPTFPWLRRHGVAVYDVEQFATHLRTGALTLRPEEGAANRAALRRVAEEYSYADFRQRLARWLDARAD